MVADFEHNYLTDSCYETAVLEGNMTNVSVVSIGNHTQEEHGEEHEQHACLRENSLLFLLLMLGTLWLGHTLYNFTKTYIYTLPF